MCLRVPDRFQFDLVLEAEEKELPPLPTHLYLCICVWFLRPDSNYLICANLTLSSTLELLPACPLPDSKILALTLVRHYMRYASFARSNDCWTIPLHAISVGEMQLSSLLSARSRADW